MRAPGAITAGATLALLLFGLDTCARAAHAAPTAQPPPLTSTDILGDTSTTRGNQAIFSAPLVAGGVVPGCTTADGCVLDCFASTSSWECRDGAGATVAVTQGVGTTFEDTGFGGMRAARISTDARAPSLATNAALEALWGSDHTLVTAQSPNTGHYSSANPIPFSHGYYAQDGILLQTTATNVTAYWSQGASVVTVGAVIPTSERWAVVAARKNGTSYTVRANGNSATTVSAFNATAPTGDPVWFGRYQDANRFTAGPQAWTRIYSRALSDAELARIEAGFAGTHATDRVVTVARASTRWCEGDDGYFRALGDNMGCVSSKGLLVEEARTNQRTNNLDASAWTAVGTPVVTTNTSSGPFARIAGGAEMDRVEDNDGAAFEGVHAGSVSTPANGAWTVSCYLKAGTSSAAQLRWNTAGTGMTNCDWTGLTGDAARYSCSGTLAGSPGFLEAHLVVGTTTAVQGSIEVTGCQLEAGAFASSPIVTGAAALARTADVPTMPTTGLVVARGTMKASGMWEHPTTALGSFGVLADTRSVNSGVVLYARPDLRAAYGEWWVSGVRPHIAATAGLLTFTQGVHYPYSVKWTPDTTVTVTRLGGETGTTPAGTPLNAHGTTMRIGHAGGSLYWNGWIRNVEVYPE